MTRLLIRIFVAAALTVGFAGTSHAQLPKQLRVLTYNIHHAEGLDGKIDLRRIAGVINAAKPDVATIQEVDQGVARTDRLDMPAVLAELTGMQRVFARNIDHEGGGYGTMMLTRLPIKGSEQHRLPAHYDGEQRGVQVIELGRGEDTVLFFGTHLDYRSEDHERMASIKKINELAARFEGTPMILAGDLNAEPDSRVMREFGKLWKRTNDKPFSTFRADNPQKQIDYVLVRPADRWRVIETGVIDEPTASDHRPVMAVLELLDKAAK